MNKQYITIKGMKYRVEANWRAITTYLAEQGKDTIDGLSSLASLSPTTLAPLMAACINEGERLDGREAAKDGNWIAENCSMPEVSQFIAIYVAQTAPQLPAEQKAKKPKKA